MKIPFNKPFLTGNETKYIEDAVSTGKISGNGKYTLACQRFFEQRYAFRKCLLTTSCTDALEMASLLIHAGPDDEIILPSYTFVSTANAFLLRGAKLVFADSSPDHPNMDASKLETLITGRTKAIVVVHYAGVACDMNAIMALAQKHDLFVIEDAAQAIDSFYDGKPLGSFGHLAAFSFHETKNIISGEGGMLVINDAALIPRAEIIWEKGTNRSAFFRGEVDKYNWVDLGSSFLPSEVISAFLFAQLENLDAIQTARKAIWNRYIEAFADLDPALVSLPTLPEHTTNNAHMFYLVCATPALRNALIAALKDAGVYAVFHYISLHKSPFYADRHDGRSLPNCDHFSDCLVRLPMYKTLSAEDQQTVIDAVRGFFTSQHA